MNHQQLVKYVYKCIMDNPMRHCTGCDQEHANQLGHSCLMPEDDLLIERLPLVMKHVLSYDELAALTYVSSLVLKYSQLARRRRVDFNNHRPDLSEWEHPTGYF